MLGLRHYRGVALDLYQGDLTQFVCDAMVNAANSQLAGGGGVDGAIHRVGGPVILDECRRLGGCPPGQAKATTAGALPAKWVIHAVGPVWEGGGQGEPALLAAAYHAALAEAARLGARHVAFPALSTGVYGYPWGPAAEVALTAAKDWIDARSPGRETSVRRITFVLFSLDHYHLFQETLFRLFPEADL